MAYAMRVVDNGNSPVFRIVAAVLALFGCVLGNALSIVAFVAKANDTGYFDTLQRIDLGRLADLMQRTAQPMDALFYGIAVYEAYKLSVARR